MFDLITDQISQVTLHAPSLSVLCSLVGVGVLLLLSGWKFLNLILSIARVTRAFRCCVMIVREPLRRFLLRTTS